MSDEIEALLLREGRAGIPTVVIQYVNGQVVVRCQRSDDALALCEYVVKQHETPKDRSLN